MRAVNVTIRKEDRMYLILFFLLVCMVCDIKEQKIPTVWLMGNLIVGIIYRRFFWEDDFGGRLIISLMPGLFLFILSKITRQLGTGDGCMVMVTGCFLAVENHIRLLVVAFFLAAVFAMGIVIVRHETVNRRIPFAPFLFMANGIIIWRNLI